MSAPLSESYSVPSGAVVSGGRYRMSDFWRNLAPGWAAITPALPVAPYGIMAFSGFSVDSEAGKVYFFGGGHADYWGDEVWEFDLETRASMVKHYEPTFTKYITVAETAAYVNTASYPGAINVPGVGLRPISRHTGASQCWIPDTKSFFVEGNSLYSGNGSDLLLPNGLYPMDALDRWVYSAVSKTWSYEGSDYNGVSINRLGGYNKYHTGRKLLISGIISGNNFILRSWNPTTKGITLLSTLAIGAAARAIFAIDAAQDILYLFVHSSTETNPLAVWKYSFSANTWESISGMTGAVPTSYSASYPSVVLSEKTGKYLIMHNTTLGIFAFDPATKVWTNSIAVPSGIMSTFNGWHYDDRRQVTLFAHGALNGYIKIYAYKE